MDKIDEFFNKRLITSPATCKSYRMNIKSYFKLINKDINTYFNNNFTLEDYDNDLREAYTIQHEKSKPDLSLRTFFNAVKQFMIANKKELKELEFWEILKARIRGAEPESDEAILNANDIKTILSHGNACSRALYLILASSGRRISEVLAIEPDDINLTVTPTTMNIKKGLNRKSTKTKMKTLCYISDEATEAYKTWMKERDSYLNFSIKKTTKYKKNPNDKRVFPMSYSNALRMWKTLLIKAKLVETELVWDKWRKKNIIQIKQKNKGDRLVQHPHCLRKFYRGYLGDADLAEYLMGHSTLLTRTYRQMKPEDLAKKYLAVMPNVTIFESPLDLTEINKSLAEKDKQIQNMQQEMQVIRMELLEVKMKQVQELQKIELEKRNIKKQR